MSVFISIISGVVTSIIASIIFYIFIEYIPKRRKNKFLVEYIANQYWKTKICILFEFSGILPQHTAWELIITNPVNNQDVNFSDEQNLYNYDLLKECFSEKLKNIDLDIEYKNLYIEDMAKRLLEMMKSITAYDFIISNEMLFQYFTEISRFLFVYQDDAYKIIDEFIMGGRPVTVSQLNNIIIPNCGIKDDFIDILRKAYQDSLYKPLEKLICFFKKHKIEKITK